MRNRVGLEASEQLGCAKSEHKTVEKHHQNKRVTRRRQLRCSVLLQITTVTQRRRN